MRRALVAFLVAVPLVAMAPGVARASTGSTPKVSTDHARSEIARLVESTYAGMPFGNVACPSEVTRRPGSAFTCTVQLSGGFLVVDAAHTGTRGAVELSSPQAVLGTQRVEEFVATNASLAATVDCGPGAWLVRRPGQEVSCTAALADGTTRVVVLTVRDVDGNVTITGVA